MKKNIIAINLIIKTSLMLSLSIQNVFAYQNAASSGYENKDQANSANEAISSANSQDAILKNVNNPTIPNTTATDRKNNSQTSIKAADHKNNGNSGVSNGTSSDDISVNQDGNWGSSFGKIVIENVKVQNDWENKLLGHMIKASDLKLEELLEKDKKSVKTFKITYPVSVKDIKKNIIQFGLLKTLPKKVKEYIQNPKHLSVPVQYKLHDPITIRFVCGGEMFDAPVLMTPIGKKEDKNK